MHELKPTHYLQTLQPLRVPAGWQMCWNTFQAIEVPADGFAGSSLLYLQRHDQRLVLDVEWRPEFDPDGFYRYYVQRQPLRTDNVSALDDELLDSAESRSRDDVVTWINRWLDRGLVEAPPSFSLPEPALAPPARSLRPLRFPSGWILQRNALTETAPVFAATSDVLLLRAIAPQRRFRLDVTRKPEGDGQASYLIELLYAPSLRTERGHPRIDGPLSFDGDVRSMHRLVTTDYDELVRYVEVWLWRAAAWAVE